MSNTQTEKLIGHVGVDSGQLIITDPCYIKSWGSNDFGSDQKPDIKGLYSYDYEGACSATLSEDQAGALRFQMGHEGAGVAFSTGFGDGLYPVYATFSDEGEWGTRVKSIRVEFIEEEDYGDEY
jgi:hypothetical protein